MKEHKDAIAKFRFLSEAQMQSLREELHLSMTVAQMAMCADYYRSTEKRDPSTDELRLLDILISKAEDMPSARSLTQLSANDTAAAETYEDLVKKRFSLSSDPLPPCTLTELLSVASNYLERAGKAIALPKYTLMLEDCRYTKRIPGTASGFGISGSGHQLRILPKKGISGKPETGDALILFSPHPERGILDYQKNIGPFLNAYGAQTPWKILNNVGEGGLLPSLLQMDRIGFWIELNRLASEKYISPFAPLTESFVGCHFVVVSPDVARSIVERAAEFGIRATVFATVMHANRFTFVGKTGELFSIGADFIKKLLTAQPVSAKLDDDTANPLQKIRHTPTSSASCAYLKKNKLQMSSDCIEVGETLCAATLCKSSSDFYRHAIYTTLCSVLSLAVAGLAYTEQRLAVGVSIPVCSSKNEEEIGKAVSAMLGIYRAQAELGIPSAASSLLSDHTLKDPQVTVFSTAEGRAISGTHLAPENPVYCFAPAFDEAGLPDFSSLRALLQELTTRRRNGSIVSARVICNESVTDGLMKMAHDGLYCKIEDRIASEGALPLAVIVEANAPIAGQTPIGTVCQKECDPIPTEQLPLPTALQRSLIWSDQTEFVLLGTVNNLDAQVLCNTIIQKGGNATLFESDRTDAGALSRAMLGAHVFILCGDAHFPETPHTRFALETLLRAGGACWIVGRTVYSPLSKDAALIQKQLPESLLDSILGVDA